jgi:hypothetical protein
MKRNLLVTILLIILISNYSQPQFFADSSISEYVVDLFNSSDSLNYLSSAQQDSINNSPNSRLSIDRIARLYYKTFDEDPVGYNMYLEKMHSIWKTHPYVPNSKPAMKINQLRKKIAEKYGVPFTEIVGTPAFLRCKYLNQTSSYISDGILNSNFNFIIEDVIKGSKYFNINDSITIKMVGNIESPYPIFIKNKSYLIPVGTLTGLNQGSFNIIFKSLVDEYDVWVMGKPPKTFLIENNEVLDTDYMGFSKMNWQEFKKLFVKKYLIFN